MLPYKIGNWLINQDEIKWDGKPKVNYEIAKETITDCGPQERENMYDWLVHLPDKTWLTKEDIYALNTAFIYAMEIWEIPFPKEQSFVETFIEQNRLLENK